MDLNYKSLIYQSGMVHKGCCMNFQTRLETSKHRQSAIDYPQDGYNCPATTQR